MKLTNKEKQLVREYAKKLVGKRLDESNNLLLKQAKDVLKFISNNTDVKKFTTTILSNGFNIRKINNMDEVDLDGLLNTMMDYAKKNRIKIPNEYL